MVRAAKMTVEEAKAMLRKLRTAQKQMLAIEDRLVGGYTEALVQSQARLLAKLQRIIAEAPDMSKMEFNERMRWYTTEMNRTSKLIARSGFEEANVKLVHAYGGLADATNGVLVAAGIDEAWTLVPDEWLGYLRRRDLQYLDVLGREAATKIDKVMMEMTVGGATRGDMLAELQGVITGEYEWGEKTGLYEWHAGTYVRTGMHRTAQGFLNAQAAQVGLEQFIYIGPSDDDTREFCQELVGNTYTRDEIAAMDNGQTGDVFTDGGGYNCRHSWLAVPQEFVEALREYEEELLVA